jgi:hypothetical protein
LELLKKFAALIATYGIGDLLLFSMRKAAGFAGVNLSDRLRHMIPDLISKASREGSAAAVPPGGTGGGFTGGVAGDSWESHAARSARAIREDLEGKFNLIGYRVTRFADDAYKAVAADAMNLVVSNTTPVGAQHAAYQRLVRQGVSGFVDSKGRNWELSAYVEAATRSAAQRAFNVSHLDRMQALGIDLFVVPDDGHPCPLCLPWQGRILSVAPDTRADATVAEATAAGLFHVNCRHVLTAYLPGVTEVPPPRDWSSEDQARYALSQQQRRLERDIRAAKRELAAAFTPEMRSQAQFRLRRAQANMRAFIDQTGRVRNTRREQLNLGAQA